MLYSALENKLKSIPEQYFEQVSSFLNLILSLSNNTTSKKQFLPDILYRVLQKVSSNILII